MSRRNIFKSIRIMLLGVLVPSVVWPQVIDEVSPSQGFIDEITALTIDGSDFAPGSRVLLRPGGPAHLGISLGFVDQR